MTLARFVLGALVMAGCREAACRPTMDIHMPYRPGEIWRDDAGRPIQAHGGGLLFHGGVYYWYGEDKSPDDWNGTGAGRVSWVRCYSSRDLATWHDEGTVLGAQSAPGHDLAPGRVVERPKVLFNAKTGTFVMWMHIDSPDYKDARAGVAMSPTPTGPFEYLGSVRPDDAESRDMTAWVDDDGTAYLVHSSEGNATMHVSVLSDDYRRPAGRFVRAFEGRFREAPAVFKHDGRYYLVSSHCTGWKPNEAEIAVADSMLGPWTVAGNPCVGTEAQRTLTFGSQSTYVVPVPGRPGWFVFMADRWNAKDLPDSRYVWLPLRVVDGRVEIRWHDAWDFGACGGDAPPGGGAMTGDELKSLEKSSVVFKSLDGVKADELRLSEADMAWWRDAKFGMFIHWGLYAIPARGEWVMHQEKIPAEEYAKLAGEFDPRGFDAGAWAAAARDAGMKYMVMVARHHDGFALWDSPGSYRHFTSMATAAKRDFVKAYVEACRAAGLRVGLYYSPLDWRFPGYFKPRELAENAALLKAQGYAQVGELMSRYGAIDILWYDGGWLAHTGTDADAAWFWEPVKLNTMVRRLQPKVVINPRSGWIGDFQCDEGSHAVKGPIIPRPWEKCLNLNDTAWGFTERQNLLSLEYIVATLVDVVCRGGNVLLNVGPDRNGVIPPAHVARLREVGRWLGTNGEAVYGTRPGPFQPVEGAYGSTHRGRRVYLFVQRWPDSGTVRLPALPGRTVVSCRVLSGAAGTCVADAGGLALTVPVSARTSPVTVVSLELDGDAPGP